MPYQESALLLRFVGVDFHIRGHFQTEELAHFLPLLRVFEFADKKRLRAELLEELDNLAVVSRFSTDANIGAVILFVLWLYYTALVFLIGAVVAETWDLWSRQRTGLKPVPLAGS